MKSIKKCLIFLSFSSIITSISAVNNFGVDLNLGVIKPETLKPEITAIPLKPKPRPQELKPKLSKRLIPDEILQEVQNQPAEILKKRQIKDLTEEEMIQKQQELLKTRDLLKSNRLVEEEKESIKDQKHEEPKELQEQLKQVDELSIPQDNRVKIHQKPHEEDHENKSTKELQEKLKQVYGLSMILPQQNQMKLPQKPNEEEGKIKQEDFSKLLKSIQEQQRKLRQQELLKEADLPQQEQEVLRVRKQESEGPQMSENEGPKVSENDDNVPSQILQHIKDLEASESKQSNQFGQKQQQNQHISKGQKEPEDIKDLETAAESEQSKQFDKKAQQKQYISRRQEAERKDLEAGSESEKEPEKHETNPDFEDTKPPKNRMQPWNDRMTNYGPHSSNNVNVNSDKNTNSRQNPVDGGDENSLDNNHNNNRENSNFGNGNGDDIDKPVITGNGGSGFKGSLYNGEKCEPDSTTLCVSAAECKQVGVDFLCVCKDEGNYGRSCTGIGKAHGVTHEPQGDEFVVIPRDKDRKGFDFKAQEYPQRSPYEARPAQRQGQGHLRPHRIGSSQSKGERGSSVMLSDSKERDDPVEPPVIVTPGTLNYGDVCVEDAACKQDKHLICAVGPTVAVKQPIEPAPKSLDNNALESDFYEAGSRAHKRNHRAEAEETNSGKTCQCGPKFASSGAPNNVCKNANKESCTSGGDCASGFCIRGRGEAGQSCHAKLNGLFFVDSIYHDDAGWLVPNWTLNILLGFAAFFVNINIR